MRRITKKGVRFARRWLASKYAKDVPSDVRYTLDMMISHFEEVLAEGD